MLHQDITTAPPRRVLFVLSRLQDGDEARQIFRLVRALAERFAVSVISCSGDAAAQRHATLLAAVGADVDLVPHHLDMEETVTHLTRCLSRFDVIVAAQDVADLYPALDRLHHRPRLIEWGRSRADALSGPKHHTHAYVAPTETVHLAIAARPDFRTGRIERIGPLFSRSTARDPAGAAKWERLLDTVCALPRPRMEPTEFRSFWQGGFECSTHRLWHGRRLDVIAASRHDVLAEADYRQLAAHGMQTVRDGARWHLVEPSPGRYDFTSLTPMIEAAARTGTQVIWDLLHYGYPDDVDIYSPGFADRFARYAGAVARHMRDTTDSVPFWCPVNEVSFHSWAGGDVAYLNPFGRRRGFELKVQLARASIAAMTELRAVDRRARFVHCEPAIAIHPDPGGANRQQAEEMNEAQFQAFDLLSGRLWPQIGGQPDFLDIVGINYYALNQWHVSGGHLFQDHPHYRPLSDILTEAYARYGRPVVVSETGIEDEHRAGWLLYVASEAMRAAERGVPVQGLCLYPVLDHLGWDDDRYCPNGLLGLAPGPYGRSVHGPLAEALARAQRMMAEPWGTEAEAAGTKRAVAG